MSNEVIQVYEELAIKHNAAYAAFKSIYEAKNPAPILRKPDRADWYIVLGIMVIVVASVIVSGSRTVAEFGFGAIGVAAFVMLECTIVAFAFIRTRNHFNKERMEDVKKLTNRGLWLAFTVALAANVHATLKQNGVVTSEWINTLILLLVALSAPTLAFISGDIMGLEYMRSNSKRREIEDSNQSLFGAWADGLNKSWQASQSKWGVKIEVENERISIPSHSSGIPMESIGNVPSKSTLGHTKAPDARKRVIEYLTEHPEAFQSNPLEIASILEVGKSTVYAVIKEMKGQSK